MMCTAGLDAMPLTDWLALSLFATCHDLRQRELVDFSHPIGNNEAASICETRRILALSGFDSQRDREMYVALDMMTPVRPLTRGRHHPPPNTTPLKW